MATRPKYRRVEFTVDFGDGPVQAAFVDFSSQGISFGVPHNIQIYGGTPEDPSPIKPKGEYQRTTVHVDGKVVTHLWPGFNPPQLQDFNTDQAPLAQWSSPASWRFDLDLNPEYRESLWFADARQGDSTCLSIPVSFVSDATGSVVQVCLVNPQSPSDLSEVFPGEGQLWGLTGGRPWVLVRMSNVDNPGIVQLSSVGRNYR